MNEYFEGLGITRDELALGTPVMVAASRTDSLVNGNPCLIAWAVVRGPANPEKVGVDPGDAYWLDVYMIPGGPPLLQMYRAGEILGVPALGLTMDGAPPR